MSRHTVTLELNEATTEQLRRELVTAEKMARKCEAQGSWWHTWGARADAIRSVLSARAAAEREDRADGN